MVSAKTLPKSSNQNFQSKLRKEWKLIKMKTVTKKDRTKKYISIWTSERDERFSKVSK